MLAAEEHAAMEPCPYRQGESALTFLPSFAQLPPQWSPALIGRESTTGSREPRSAAKAAMEPCPYRQGETVRADAAVVSTRPQWSPALIGRERWSTGPGYGSWPAGRNGALPLSAGRARADHGCGRPRGPAAMEPCPYRQGERLPCPGRIRASPSAAMEPCPYRQGEKISKPHNPRGRGRRNGALPLSAGRDLYTRCGSHREP